MNRNWTFGKKLAVGFGFAVLVVALVGLAGYRSIVQLVETSVLLEHSFGVRAKVQRLESLLKDAETGQRGFVLTGNETYLQPYQSARTALATTLEAAQRATVDNDRQQRRIADLRTVIDRKMTELDRTIELRRTEGFDAALSLIKTDSGKVAMDRIRQLLAEIDDEESSLLTVRSREANQSAESARFAITWGALVGTLTLAIAGLVIARSLTRQIGRSVGHIEASSTELQAASNQLATGAREQTTAMNEISTTISELLATSRQIAESARHVTRIADETSQAARDGEKTVLLGNDAMLGIRRQVDSIVSHMLDLGKRSQQVGAVLDIVSELAEQTNILAINATIEAAGAGEAGKRFGVVADEIRKLSDRVGGSTKEIRSLIDDVRASVNTTIMTTETGSKATDVGTLQFAEVQGVFAKISARVGTTTDAAREIELSTMQQTSAVEQVNVAVASVVQAAKESEVSTTQTVRTAGELSRLSGELMALVQADVNRARVPLHGD